MSGTWCKPGLMVGKRSTASQIHSEEIGGGVRDDVEIVLTGSSLGVVAGLLGTAFETVGK